MDQRVEKDFIHGDSGELKSFIDKGIILVTEGWPQDSPLDGGKRTVELLYVLRLKTRM